MQIINFGEFETNQRNTDQTERIHALKRNALVQRLLVTRRIPEVEIDKHPAMWARWLEQIEKCQGCKGLATCKQRQKGYVEVLNYDGILSTELEACALLKKKESSEKHLSQYLINDLGEAFYHVSFQNSNPEAESDAYKRVWMECKRLADEGKGAYLYGNMGVGKTYLAACAANQYAKNHHKVAFVHCPRLLERFLSSYKTGEYKTELERLTYADFVVFDDIGAEDVTERYRSLLLGVLDARMQNHKPTWFTSNEDFNSLEHHFLTTSRGEDLNEAMRIMERIKVLAKPIEMLGENRRNIQK